MKKRKRVVPEGTKARKTETYVKHHNKEIHTYLVSIFVTITSIKATKNGRQQRRYHHNSRELCQTCS